MIGQHPQLVGLPELKLFCCATIGDLEASLPSYWIERGITHRSPGLVRAVAQFEFGDQTLESLSLARAWLQDRRHWSGADVLDVLLSRLTPRSAIEKSPDNVSDDTALTRMASAYPCARYLHLTRHPITTQRSMEEHRRRTVPTHPQEGEPMSGIASWYAIHRRILQFAADLPVDRYLRIRGEDVLNDTDSQLRVIAAWLDVSTEDSAIEAMKHPEASPFASLQTADSGIVGGNDPTFLSAPTPRSVDVPSNLKPPPGWTADLSIWKMVTDLANRLGYF
jgi:sulfotransferase family protein